MHRQHRYSWHAAAVVVVGVASTGCHMFLNSWFDPSQMGEFGREATIEIRTSLSIQDTPIGIPGATDPQPGDLIANYEEYRYAIGDVVSVRIFELLARNTETAAQGVIDEIGTITIPVLGQIRVAGMTRNEITEELRTLVRERGYVQDPTVIVEPGVRRGLSYLLFGAIAAPNLYPISKPDTRLLEVLNTAGGLVDTVTEVYVIRDGDAPDDVAARGRVRQRGALASAAGRSVLLSDGLGRGGAFARPQPNDAPPTGSAGDRPDEVTEELLEAMAPPTGPSTTSDPTTSVAPRSMTDSADTPSDLEGSAPVGEAGTALRWIFVEGEGWIESATPDSPVGVETGVPAAPLEPGKPSTPEAAPDLDWTRLVSDVDTRVIRVSAQGLRDGDYRQNIVVRGGDTIRVMAGQFGEYYMMGQVSRPGAYSLTGRQITLKTAIASSGNLAPLAWPDRCTIYRRYGDREEMHQVNLPAIFAGREPDVLLKPNDLVLVGTHPIAPFLAVARNAFRLTYGFGFVYDRNFADQDQFGPRINPANLQSGAGSNFPNIFR